MFCHPPAAEGSASADAAASPGIMPGGNACSAWAELGPSLPSRIDLRILAGEVHAMAAIALDCTVAGPGCDVRRAVAKLDQIRALLGPGR